MSIDTITAWHKLVATKNADGLDDLLAEEVVFHSPVVHTPQVGKKITRLYLGVAFHVLFNDSFKYVREVIGTEDAVLEFETLLDGILVNGVDLIKWNAEGKIVDFKVMLRPLKAINLIHKLMAENLGALRD